MNKIELVGEPYRVFATPEAKRKMELYCEICPQEIGWFAYVNRINSRNFLIEDCVLLKQQVHAATTEIDPGAMLVLWNESTTEQRDKLKCWGHSHVEMSPFPSGQDDSQMKEFASNNEWFIRIITNKKNVWNIDIYEFDARGNSIKINLDNLEVYNPALGDLRELVKKEIAEKVSQKTYTTSTPAAPVKTRDDYDCSDNYYKNRRSTKVNARKSSSVKPLFEDINIKYLTSIDEALADPNYWIPILD